MHLCTIHQSVTLSRPSLQCRLPPRFTVQGEFDSWDLSFPLPSVYLTWAAKSEFVCLVEFPQKLGWLSTNKRKLAKLCKESLAQAHGYYLNLNLSLLFNKYCYASFTIDAFTYNSHRPEGMMWVSLGGGVLQRFAVSDFTSSIVSLSFYFRLDTQRLFHPVSLPLFQIRTNLSPPFCLPSLCFLFNLPVPFILPSFSLWTSLGTEMWYSSARLLVDLTVKEADWAWTFVFLPGSLLFSFFLFSPLHLSPLPSCLFVSSPLHWSPLPSSPFL